MWRECGKGNWLSLDYYESLDASQPHSFVDREEDLRFSLIAKTRERERKGLRSLLLVWLEVKNNAFNDECGGVEVQ